MGIHHVVSFTTDIIGVCLNCCMMFIILRYSSDKIGRYKYFLFFYTLNAAMYSSTQCLLLQNWVVPVNGGYLYLSTVHFLPRQLQIWGVTVWVCFFYTNLFVVAWSFWYRMACVTDSDFFRSKWKVFGMFIFSVCGLAFLAANIITMHPTDLGDQAFADRIYRVNGYSVNLTGYIGGPFYYGDRFNTILFTSTVVHFVANFLFMCFIGYCWYNIGSKIRALQSLSQRRFQYRIYILLTIQTILPIVFNAFPVVIAFIFSALRWDIGNWMLIFGMVISVAQMIDPICMAVLITDYKRAIAKILHIRLPTNTVSYSVTTQPNKLVSEG